jgi:hypothetical protein
MSFVVNPYWYKYPCTDYDVLLFLKVTGITDQTIASALCALVAGMKANGTWAKCNAIYPFVGATATTHKYNLKNPVDSNAAFRLSFVGGWTHSASGAKPNGTNGYANTFLSPSLVQSVNNNGMGMYITERTVAGTDPVQMGCLVNFLTSASTNVVTPTSMSSRLNAANVVAPITGGAGNFDVHRTAATITKYYKNGVPIQTINSGGVLPNLSIFLGNLNLNGVPYSVGWINSEFRFAYIGQGLNDTEITSLSSLVQQFQISLGRQIAFPYVSDTDAQAFVNAANITSVTQANAVNTLVIDLKNAGVWTKLNAVYPMVGGTAFTHKFNLKDPRDLDVAFRLLFVNTWTHSANGALPNGTNAYANTFFNPSLNASLNSHHISYYSRSNVNLTETEIGVYVLGSTSQINARYTNVSYYRINTTDTGWVTFTDTDSRAFYLANRTASNVVNGWRNSIKVANGTVASTSLTNLNYYLGALNNNGVSAFYSTKQCAFATIGTGLTDGEASALYTAVQTFQTTLGRSIGTQTVSDSDAQAFINAAGLTDQVQTTAIKNLVLNLKANGLWTRMSAIYPMVGETATTHKFNLKDPRDLDVAYRLFFSGGWVHSDNGALPNASNTYANTFLSPATSLELLNTHLSFYSRTLTIGNNQRDVAAFVGGGIPSFSIGTNTGVLVSDHYWFTTNRMSRSIPNAQGLMLTSRTNNTTHKSYRNGVQLDATDAVANGLNTMPNIPLYLGAANQTPLAVSAYSTKQYAFASIGNGLTDSEALAFYNIVQTYQMQLGRFIGFPVTLDQDANIFITAAGITDLTQISAINTLVTNLKIAQLWPKMKAIYPMVGGTALAHKFNLKNPADTNAAYRLFFSGTWVHSATGALPNGTTAFADTFLNPTTSLGINSSHISYYSRTNIGENRYDMGAGADPSAYIVVQARSITGNFRAIVYTGNLNDFANADSRGLFVSNRPSSTLINGFRNTTKIINLAQAAIAQPNRSIYLGALNYQTTGGATLYSTKECAFATIGDGLTDEEQSNLYTIIQYFQITLNRQV